VRTVGITGTGRRHNMKARWSCGHSLARWRAQRTAVVRSGAQAVGTMRVQRRQGEGEGCGRRAAGACALRWGHVPRQVARGSEKNLAWCGRQYTTCAERRSGQAGDGGGGMKVLQGKARRCAHGWAYARRRARHQKVSAEAVRAKQTAQSSRQQAQTAKGL